MRVYVHLARGFDAEKWRDRWSRSDLIGLNEESPYGYHRAAKLGARMTYSVDWFESFVGRLLRKGVRLLVGFDLVHAWRNRAKILSSEIVWTHTESQHLAVAAVLRVLSRSCADSPRPRLIAQSVWLFDNWQKFSWLRRTIYRRLMSSADVLTVLSSRNLAIARDLFPGVRVELVQFGISADRLARPTLRSRTGLNLLSVGNDRHRDWETLLCAVAAAPRDVHLKIVSGTIDRKLAARYRADVVKPTSNLELHQLYAWADAAVVPLGDNQHASGITAIQEAVVKGLPVVATDVGGLREYFSEDQVAYVAPGDPEDLRQLLELLAGAPSVRLRLADAAQRSLGCPGLSSESYVLRHFEISQEVLGRSPTYRATRQSAGWQVG